jgi:hypothetical protein
MDIVTAAKHLVELVEKRYPGWRGYQDPRFIEQETAYKRKASAEAKESLSQTSLDALIEKQAYKEIMERVKQVTRSTNLLYLAAPSTGDAAILHHRDADLAGLCHAIRDLLHGHPEPYERLDRFSQFATQQGLPNKWTLPTYLLFLCQPEDNILVKPTTAQWTLGLVDQGAVWQPVPNGLTYRALIDLAKNIRNQTSSQGPTDLIDVQSLIWDAHLAVGTKGIRKHEELIGLLEKCVSEYFTKEEGIDHFDMYAKSRAEAREAFEKVRQKAAAGEDYTDDVLLRFLPHSNTKPNQERGAWIHVAPAIMKDIKSWFEGWGLRQTDDWPHVAKLILDFMSRCVDDPSSLQAACEQFSTSPYAKGLQTGMLTPFLNALDPDAFTLINNKSRRTVNYFLETSYKQPLTFYPATNVAAKRLLEAVPDGFLEQLPTEIHPGDVLDAFCHWLVAIEKFVFGKTSFWKLAPGRQAWQWEECRDNGFAAVGWDDFGDLTNVTQEEFEQLQASLLETHPEWTKEGTRQLWRFAKRIRDGDRIVANRGTSEVLGIGTVTGLYYFVPNTKYGHRIPVEWDETTPRRVEEPGWKRTLIRLDKDRFEKIRNAPPIIEPPPPPPPPPRPIWPEYSLQECSNETNIDLPTLKRWIAALERKKQVVLYGPPGTGKTYVAEHLARHLVGGGSGELGLVQFHPSYAYEDFIQGIRPETGDDGALRFNTRKGRFMEFCERAARTSDTSVLVVDEINRANLSKVFGELMYLLEYRDRAIPLAVGQQFSIPDNVRIIGTMNTADRSIALVDHALRRRFAFLPLYPDYDILAKSHEQGDFDVEPLIQVLQDLNGAIGDRNFEIGVSFFLVDDLGDELEGIWLMEIEPYLEEVFFDRPDALSEYSLIGHER